MKAENYNGFELSALIFDKQGNTIGTLIQRYTDSVDYDAAQRRTLQHAYNVSRFADHVTISKTLIRSKTS